MTELSLSCLVLSYLSIELLAEVRKYVSLAVGSFRRLQDESAEHFVRHVYDLVR